MGGMRPQNRADRRHTTDGLTSAARREKALQAFLHGRGVRQRPALPTAREWFAILLPAVHAARPVIGRWRNGEPRYGKSTFRNVIGDDGRLAGIEYLQAIVPTKRGAR